MCVCVCVHVCTCRFTFTQKFRHIFLCIFFLHLKQLWTLQFTHITSIYVVSAEKKENMYGNTDFKKDGYFKELKYEVDDVLMN